MRTLAVVFLLLVTLLGALAWFVAAPLDADAASPSAGAASRSMSAASTELDALRDGGLAPASVRGELESADALDGSAQAPGVARQRTRVCGRAVDERGAPLEGVRVLCALASRGPSSPLDSDEWNASRRGRREALSEADGRFCVDDVAYGVLRLALRAVDHAPLDIEGVIVAEGEAHDLGDVTLSLGARLSGVVLDARGFRVGAAWLIRPFDEEHPSLGRAPGDRGIVLGQSDAEGQFDLRGQPVGPWTLLVHSPAYPDSAAHGATTAPGEHVAGLVLRMPDSAAISGSIRTAPGANTPRFDELEVVASVLGDEAAPVGVARSSKRSGAVLSDGTFRIQGLEPDRTYRLRPVLLQREHALEAYAEADAGDSGVLLSLGAQLSIHVRPRDALSGAALSDVRARLLAESSDGRARALECYTTTPADGGLLVLSDRLPNDGETVVLSLSRDAYVTARSSPVRPEPGVVTEIGALDLTPLARMRLRVSDAGGAPVRDALVSVLLTTSASGESFELEQRPSRAASSRVLKTDTTDSSGMATVYAEAGECGVAAARHMSFASTQLVQVCFDGADAAIDLVLVDGAALRVTVRDPSGAPLRSRTVRADRASDDSQSPTEALRFGAVTESTGPDGVATFAALTPARYVVRVEEPRAGAPRDAHERDATWAEVEIVEGQPQSLELVALKRGALSGRVTSARRVVPNAEVSLSAGGRSSRSSSGSVRVRTDADGRYRVEDLGAGAWSVTVSHADFLSSTRVELSYDGDDRTFDIDLPRDPVSGRVVDARGDPIADAKVVVGRWTDVSKSKDRRARAFDALLGGAPAAVTGDYGDFELIGLPRGRLAIEVRHPNFEVHTTKPFVTSAGAPLALGDIVLERAGHVTVELASMPSSGPRPRALLVRLDGPKDRSGRREVRAANLDRTGKTRFHSVAAGKWRVELDPRVADAPRVRREIRVEPGKTELVLVPSL